MYHWIFFIMSSMWELEDADCKQLSISSSPLSIQACRRTCSGNSLEPVFVFSILGYYRNMVIQHFSFLISHLFASPLAVTNATAILPGVHPKHCNSYITVHNHIKNVPQQWPQHKNNSNEATVTKYNTQDCNVLYRAHRVLYIKYIITLQTYITMISTAITITFETTAFKTQTKHLT